MSPTTRSGKSVVVPDSSEHHIPTTYLRPRRQCTSLSIDDGLFKVPKSVSYEGRQIANIDDCNKVIVSHPSSSKLLIKKRKKEDSDALYIPSKSETKTRKLYTNKVIVANNPNFPSLATRISPKGFWYLVQCLETYEQINAIQDIGFIGLYHLRVHMLPLQLCYWLVDNYCAPKNALILPDGKELRLTEEDVHATLGLPMGTKKVEVAKYKCSESDFVDFYDTWREQFGIRSGTVPIKVLEQFLLNQIEGGYWFKINFVVYVVSTLIDNNQKPVVNHRILKSLMNVAQIPEYNWCEFVLRSLRDRKVEWASSQKTKLFGGPILFLLLVYVDRVVHGQRTVPREFFTLSGWTTTLLNAREKCEMVSGQFGIGIIEDRFEDVIDDGGNDDHQPIENNETDYPNERAQEERNPSDNVYNCAEINNIEEYMVNLATLTKSAAEGLMSLGSMLELGAPVVSQNMVAIKLRGAASNLLNGECTADKPPNVQFVNVEGECDVVKPSSVQSVNVEGVSSKVVSEDPKAKERDPSILNPDDDDFYSLPIFDQAIEAAVTLCKSRSMRRTHHPSVANQINTCSDAGSNGSNTEVIDKVVGLAAREAFIENCDDEPDLSCFYLDPPNLNFINEGQSNIMKEHNEGDISAKLETKDPIVEPVVQPVSNSGKQVVVDKAKLEQCLGDTSSSPCFIDAPSFNLHLSQEDQPHIENIPPDDKVCGKRKLIIFGREIQTRRRSGRILTVECRSPFARGDVNHACKISAHEKMVSDYLFFDCGKDVALNSENVFDYKLVATRHHFYSLKPGNQVSTSVIDCWAAFLNYREKERNVSTPTRFFCSTLLYEMFMNNVSVKGGDPKRCFLVFNQVLAAELKTFHWIPLRDIDLFFIPVIFRNHFYLYVIDLKGKAFHIIDNRSTRASVENYYSYSPWMMAEAFQKYFDVIPEVQQKSAIFKSLVPTALKMKWQNTKNNVDCGVYLMRHMEKFRGETKNWDCGLEKNQFDALQSLRVKYCCTLVDFEHNACGKDVVLHAKQHRSRTI